MKKSRLTKAAARSAAAATEASRGIWDEAVEKAAAILAEAQRKAAPVAREAGKRTADFASRRLEVWEPHIRDALDKVPPAVDAAHGKVTTELLPNLQQALHKAAGHQIAVVPAKKRKGEVRVHRLARRRRRRRGAAFPDSQGRRLDGA